MAQTTSLANNIGSASRSLSGTFTAAMGRSACRRGLAVACAAAAICAIAYVGGATDVAGTVLARGYGQALADVDTSWSSAHAGKASGNLWLSGLGDQPVAMRKAVAIGDRITVGNNNRTDVFEVVALGQIDGEPLGLQAMRLQVVTARVDGHPSGETVRFVFAVDEPRPVPAEPKPDKVL